MALINCPECGEEISDKARKCIHCGTILQEEVEVELKCIECGATVHEDDVTCKNCGCPIEKKTPQQVEVAGVKIQKKTKKAILITLGIIVVCVIVGIFVSVLSKNNNEKEYVNNLIKAQELMLDGAGDAESLCILTLKVWSNAIYEEADYETDEYTKPYGKFVDDFNDALANMYADSSVQSDIKEIKDRQSNVKEIMKKLSNPPQELEKCYESISELYDAYTRLVNVAVDPSGSYSSVSAEKNEVVSDFLSAYEKVDSQIPSLEE